MLINCVYKNKECVKTKNLEVSFIRNKALEKLQHKYLNDLYVHNKQYRYKINIENV